MEVSRTIGWTMMDGAEPNKSGAAAAAFLPATVKAELTIYTMQNTSCLHKEHSSPLLKKDSVTTTTWVTITENNGDALYNQL